MNVCSDLRVTGAPQFTARFDDWETALTFSDADFALVLPEGATKVEQVPVNTLGELMPNGGDDED